VAYANIVVKRLGARGSHKAYVAVKNLLFDLFLNPSKKYSLESLKINQTKLSDAHRDYLCDVLEKIKNNPRDLSFFDESAINF
jgi:cyclopropane fatty-acyl-phospholipid synthase-like methyltransferase